MGVRSKDIGTRRDPLETGVVDEAVIASSGIIFVRLLALALIVFTTFGTLVPLAGGWTAFREGINTAGESWWNYFRTPRGATALGMAVVLQGLIMWGQWTSKSNIVWWWRRRRYFRDKEYWEHVDYATQRLAGWIMLYAVLLLLSSIPTTYTYATWLYPLYQAVTGVWLLVIVAIVFAISVVGDMIPEIVMVRRDVATPATIAQEE